MGSGSSVNSILLNKLDIDLEKCHSLAGSNICIETFTKQPEIKFKVVHLGGTTVYSGFDIVSSDVIRQLPYGHIFISTGEVKNIGQMNMIKVENGWLSESVCENDRLVWTVARINCQYKILMTTPVRDGLNMDKSLETRKLKEGDIITVSDAAVYDCITRLRLAETGGWVSRNKRTNERQLICEPII